MRAGLFQPLTSYSLPDAVRFAAALADDPYLDTRAYGADHWARGRFNRLLTRMLFKAAEPGLARAGQACCPWTARRWRGTRWTTPRR